MTIRTIGRDLAKSVFQAHGVDETGATTLTKRLHRKQMLPFFSKLPPCLIGMEACGTAHYWARTLAAMGHEVRLIPPSYVKAYVKRGKSDALDAEAICEAVQRPTMRFVPVKTVEQQSILTAHRSRSLLVRQRTMLANALRAHLSELGLVANPGITNLANLAQQALPDADALPSYARITLEVLVRQIMALSEEITTLDRKTQLGGISKQGDRYLRRLLVVGATAVIRHIKDKPTPMAAWIRKLMEKKPFRLVSVALANKLARIAWIVLTRKEAYRPYELAA